MDRTYNITPEMLGLTWPRQLRGALREGIIGGVALLAMAAVVHARVSRSAFVEIVAYTAFMFVVGLFWRHIGMTRGLRLTDIYIEERDGPMIRREDVVGVKESIGGDCPGFVVLGRRTTPLLPEYEIFIPASLPDYEEIKQIVQTWQTSVQQPTEPRSSWVKP